MISVPTNTNSQPLPTPAPVGPQIDNSYLAMAAGQMHLEGRLVQSLYGEPETTKEPDGVKEEKTPPPEEYYPSNGRRDKPAMMT